MRIIILGLDNAGKTTIMKKISGEDITEISPTVGFNIQTLEYNGYLLNIWDVGGQKSIRPFWRNYFESTDGIIWVIDSVDKYRLEECKLQLRDILSQEKLAGIYYTSLIYLCYTYLLLTFIILFVPISYYTIYTIYTNVRYRILLGASLLILANKQDLGGALSYQAINDILNLSGTTSICIMSYIHRSSTFLDVH